MQRHAFITFSIVLVSVSGALAKKEPAIPTTATKPKQVALVRVNVTGQGYDYFRPWQKKAPFSKRALGAVLPHDRVLVTADLVTNQNYVELERAESGEKIAADVSVIDYEANLALLDPTDKKVLVGLTPLALAVDPVVGYRLSARQRHRRNACAHHRALFERRRKRKLSGVSIGRAFIFSHARSAAPQLRWTNRTAGGRLYHLCGAADARRESRCAGRRRSYCDWRSRDRSERQLCQFALRQD